MLNLPINVIFGSQSIASWNEVMRLVSPIEIWSMTCNSLSSRCQSVSSIFKSLFIWVVIRLYCWITQLNGPITAPLSLEQQQG